MSRQPLQQNHAALGHGAIHRRCCTLTRHAEPLLGGLDSQSNVYAIALAVIYPHIAGQAPQQTGIDAQRTRCGATGYVVWSSLRRNAVRSRFSCEQLTVQGLAARKNNDSNCDNSGSGGGGGGGSVAWSSKVHRGNVDSIKL